MHIKLTDPQFKANPFEFYAQLRASTPVFQTTMPSGYPVWLITRYADVQAMFKDPRLIKNYRTLMSEAELASMPTVSLLDNILDMDPPDHTRLRALIQKAFTPAMIARLEPQIVALAAESVQALAQQGGGDLMDALARPLPVSVIALILGVPAADQPRFHALSDAIITHLHTDDEELFKTLYGFAAYTSELCERRRSEPGPDLITALLQVEEDGQGLSNDELQAMIALLLIAGHETTTNLIGNGTLALLEHREQWNLLLQQPELIPGAVEELLRWTAPVELATERYAAETMTLHGVDIPRGGLVLGALASANRDPAVFNDPERLDVQRTPNRHLGFGHGIHYCVGAPLARLETSIALAQLTQRVPGLELAAPADTLRWRPSLLMRGLEQLPVQSGSRAAQI